MNFEKLMRKVSFLVLALVVIFSFGAAGEICGCFFEAKEPAFGFKFPENDPKAIRSVLSKIEKLDIDAGKPENSLGVPLAIMMVREGKARVLVGWDLAAGRQLWKSTTPINSELSVGGDLVIFKSLNTVVALRLRDGAKVFDLPIQEGWEYRGADVEKNLAVVSLSVGGGGPGGYANGRVIAVRASNGIPLWERSAGSGLLGAPVVSAGLVFVPWDRQKLAVLDASTKTEIARLLAMDYSINFVEAEAGGIYMGSLATTTTPSILYRYNENASTGNREGMTSFIPGIEPVPGDPSFGRDVFANPVVGRSTVEKIRMHWKAAPSPVDSIEMEGGQYYLHYWRYILAFDAKTNQVRWTYRSEVEIESIAALQDGVIGVDAKGKLFYIQATDGTLTWVQDASADVLTAVFDADGFYPQGVVERPEDPIAGLLAIMNDNDNRMLPIRAYITSLLALNPAPEITRELLLTYSDKATPKPLRDAVVRALERRSTGSKYLVESLELHFDYLDQIQAPPMSVVASALVNMKDRAAVPGLLEHLEDHETPVEDIREIVVALNTLGDASIVPRLKSFLTLYHADSSFIGNEDALAGLAEALLHLGDKESMEPYVQSIRDGHQTLPDLKIMLRRLLNPEEEKKIKAAEVKAAAEAAQLAAEEKAAEEAAKKEAARIPSNLSKEEISKTLLANQARFKPCVSKAISQVPNLENIRLRFVISGQTGKASSVRVLPNNVEGLRECLEKAMDQIAFRRFINQRQMATYTISIRSDDASQEGAADRKNGARDEPASTEKSSAE